MSIRQQLTPRVIRYLCYLVILLGLLAADRLFFTHRASVKVDTPHYSIASSASRPQTEEMGRMLELVHDSYSSFFRDVLPPPPEHTPRLKALLYGSRNEFRRFNRSYGWAEAFYANGSCHAYYSDEHENPYHWMNHEAVHQLNTEMAHVTPAKWLEEGIAEYFSTSQIIGGTMVLGRPNPNTYPVWWLKILATTGKLDADKTNGSVIPLQIIVSGRGGPDIDTHFNLYYLHWWTLTHFLIHHDNGKYRSGMLVLWKHGGFLPAFEKEVGPIAQIEIEWYAHALALKRNAND